jgi:hypothetical protein
MNSDHFTFVHRFSKTLQVEARVPAPTTSPWLNASTVSNQLSVDRQT